jgi:predicted dehydrogenase
VLVEKPLCFSATEGRAMVGAAEAAGVVLMVGYMKRYDEAYLRFSEALGSLADVRFVRVTTLEAPIGPYVGHLDLGPSAPPDSAVLARLEAEAEAAVTVAIGLGQDFGRTAYRGILLDTLVHELNAVRGLLGEPDRLDWVDMQPGMVTVMLRFGELPVAIHWVDLQGIARYEMELAAYSAERRLTLSFPSPFLRGEPTRLLIEDGDPGSPLARAIDQVTSYDSAFKRELVAFRAAILDGAPIPTTGRDGLADIVLCQAIVRSYRTGAPIDQPSSLSIAEMSS